MSAPHCDLLPTRLADCALVSEVAPRQQNCPSFSPCSPGHAQQSQCGRGLPKCSLFFFVSLSSRYKVLLRCSFKRGWPQCFLSNQPSKFWKAGPPGGAFSAHDGVKFSVGANGTSVSCKHFVTSSRSSPASHSVFNFIIWMHMKMIACFGVVLWMLFPWMHTGSTWEWPLTDRLQIQCLWRGPVSGEL